MNWATQWQRGCCWCLTVLVFLLSLLLVSRPAESWSFQTLTLSKWFKFKGQRQRTEIVLSDVFSVLKKKNFINLSNYSFPQIVSRLFKALNHWPTWRSCLWSPQTVGELQPYAEAFTELKASLHPPLVLPRPPDSNLSGVTLWLPPLPLIVCVVVVLLVLANGWFVKTLFVQVVFFFQLPSFSFVFCVPPPVPLPPVSPLPSHPSSSPSPHPLFFYLFVSGGAGVAGDW